MDLKLIQNIEILPRFCFYLYESERADATIKKYLKDVSRFLDFLGEAPLDRAILIDYKTELGKLHSPSGANTSLAAVNSYLRFLGRNDLMVKPFRVQKKLFCPEEKELTKNEYFRLCLAARDQKKRPPCASDRNGLRDGHSDFGALLYHERGSASGRSYGDVQRKNADGLLKKKTTTCCRGTTKCALCCKVLKPVLAVCLPKADCSEKQV